MKKFFCFIAAAVTVLSFYIKGFALDFVNPNIGFEPKCRSVLLVNLDTDAIIYEKNATERLPMASLTKIMTAILTIENIEMLSEKENTVRSRRAICVQKPEEQNLRRASL